MDCAYCGKPATHFDLCHAGHPVCNEHMGVGHQFEKLLPPKAPLPKAGRR